MTSVETPFSEVSNISSEMIGFRLKDKRTKGSTFFDKLIMILSFRADGRSEAEVYRAQVLDHAGEGIQGRQGQAGQLSVQV